ncbi:low molecular weight protein-tyrosine-phosphatase [Acinetobacter sp. MD2(2019)]|uniref:low molecular weight protein-tyrosine-phosphatase n=1 Tax=Acinetobacter sp. MD2(2019) TaxID=2605273 RepID=UPI002D1E70DE|nr:low molecular weight protein-tyrosine-phosphatase [Acinetobacter sp. MD2(2019)]MEB3752754.1 low molecular weight phosphotyrosine protein phosphatase [Acinetobacter sp. MD2(2019)]
MANMLPKKVLCVCLGNICRSPTAEAVLRHFFVQNHLEIMVDSAGTAAYHIGEAPDERSQKYALQRGYDLSHLRARQLQPHDFVNFDLILAMDLQNLKDIQKKQQQALHQFGQDACKALVTLMSAHDEQRKNQAIADPYYGQASDFEKVIDDCESASQAWVKFLKDSNNKVKTP